jgi:hypothetical protein
MLINVNSDADSQVQGYETQQMGFDTTKQAKLFHMLGSSLYTDKLAAIIRELCSNAYDSHIMAGIPDAPIYLTIPTYENPVLTIQDYGVGLSKERAMKTILCYLGSDKDSSKEFVGGWGIGSKSPFSYAATYDVTCVKDGKLVSFTCWKDENGIPQVIVADERTTEEPNGVTMSVPIKASDIYDCGNKIKRYTKWTNYNINVVSNPELNPPVPNSVIDFPQFTINVYNRDYESDMMIVYGGYHYRVEDVLYGTDYHEQFTSLKSTMKNECRISIVVKTLNDIDFSMNRETIEHTKKSKDYVGGVVSSIWTKGNSKIQGYRDLKEQWERENFHTVADFHTKYEDMLAEGEDATTTAVSRLFTLGDVRVYLKLAPGEESTIRQFSIRSGAHICNTISLAFAPIDDQFTVLWNKSYVVDRRVSTIDDKRNTLFIKAKSEGDARAILAKTTTFAGYDVSNFYFSEAPSKSRSLSNRRSSDEPKQVTDTYCGARHTYTRRVTYILCDDKNRKIVDSMRKIIYVNSYITITPSKMFLNKYKDLSNVIMANEWIEEQKETIKKSFDNVVDSTSAHQAKRMQGIIQNKVYELGYYNDSKIRTKFGQLMSSMSAFTAASDNIITHRPALDILFGQDFHTPTKSPVLSAIMTDSIKTLRRYSEVKDVFEFLDMSTLKRKLNNSDKKAIAFVEKYNLGDLV